MSKERVYLSSQLKAYVPYSDAHSSKAKKQLNQGKQAVSASAGGSFFGNIARRFFRSESTQAAASAVVEAQAEDEPQQLRDFLFAAVSGRTLYFSTRAEDLRPFHVKHNDIVEFGGELCGLKGVVVGVRGGKLWAVIDDDKHASPIPAAVSVAVVGVAQQALKAIPTSSVAWSDDVRSFLQFAPDLAVQNENGEEAVCLAPDVTESGWVGWAGEDVRDGKSWCASVTIPPRAAESQSA